MCIEYHPINYFECDDECNVISRVVEMRALLVSVGGSNAKIQRGGASIDEGTPSSLDGLLKKKHRSKWMMTGDSPMTSETTISRVSASYFTKNMFHLSESSVSSWRFLLTQHFTWPWAAGGCRCARGRKSVQPLSPGFGMVCSGCKKWSRGYCGSRRASQTSFNVRCDGEASG